MNRMKQFLFLAMAVVALSSCNKDYTCECTFPDASKNFEVPLEKMHKNDAKVVCNDYSQFVGNCSIK
jgi:hypothetical protein